MHSKIVFMGVNINYILFLELKKNHLRSFFTRPGPSARPSHGIDVSVCLCVCLCVCVFVPTWTFRYPLDTLDR